MTKFFSLMFSDINEQPSASRFLSAFVVLVPLATWAYVNIKGNAWVPPDNQLLYMIGMGLGAKVIHRKIEEGGKDDCSKV